MTSSADTDASRAVVHESDALALVHAGGQALEMIARVANVAANETEFGQMVEAALDLAIETLGAHVAHACAPDEDGSLLRLVGSRKVPQDLALRLERIPLDDGFLAARAATTREVQVVSDVEGIDPTMTLARELLLRTGCRSMVSLPLLASGKLIGVFTYALRGVHCLDGAERSAMITVANILAAGMAKALAFSAERARHGQQIRVAEALRRSEEDLTAQRQAGAERERLMREREAERVWLRAVIDRLPVPIVLIEAAEALRVSANRRAMEIAGGAIASSSESDLYLGKLLTPSGEPVPPERMPGARALRGEVITRDELVLVDQRGRHVPVEVSASPVYDPTGRLLGAVVISVDVSASKELARVREEWISIIAHDLRQPVTVIGTYAAALARRPGDEAAVRSGAEHIVSSVRRLNRMIGDLLDVSRLESQRLELEPKPTELAPLVQEILERMAGEARDRPLRVVWQGEPLRVMVDPQRFEQVLTNLVSNAIKYGAPGTEIVVEFIRHEGEVIVSVINQGAGISAEELPLLFERFHRARDARQGGVAGLGLGLYIARGLVEAHGGRIWAESEPGATTAFRFTLPLAGAGVPES